MTVLGLIRKDSLSSCIVQWTSPYFCSWGSIHVGSWARCPPLLVEKGLSSEAAWVWCEEERERSRGAGGRVALAGAVRKLHTCRACPAAQPDRHALCTPAVRTAGAFSPWRGRAGLGGRAAVSARTCKGFRSICQSCFYFMLPISPWLWCFECPRGSDYCLSYHFGQRLYLEYYYC